MSSLGWVGKQVRHRDGRTGSITGEFVGFGFAGLTISIADTDSPTAYVQLNTSGPDTGEAGWEWWCPNFEGGAQYISLGDHPVAALETAPTLKR